MKRMYDLLFARHPNYKDFFKGDRETQVCSGSTCKLHSLQRGPRVIFRNFIVLFVCAQEEKFFDMLEM